MNQITKEVLQVISTTNFNGIQLNIYGSKDEPLFKARDIADLLEIKNTNDLTSGLSDKYTATDKIRVSSSTGIEQVRDMKMITEKGFE